MIIERIKHNNHLVISDIINDQYIKQVYIGYSLKDAKREFKNMIEGNKNGYWKNRNITFFDSRIAK